MKKWGLKFSEINDLTLYQGALLMGAIDEAVVGDGMLMSDDEYQAYFGESSESRMMKQFLGG